MGVWDGGTDTGGVINTVQSSTLPVTGGSGPTVDIEGVASFNTRTGAVALSYADVVNVVGVIPRSATITIAASNATTREINQADVVCTGTADDVAINSALASMTNGGILKLSTGNFNLTAPIVFTATAQVIMGSGIASAAAGGTTINHPSVNGFTWNGTSSLWFCSVQNLYLQSGVYGMYFAPQNTTIAAGSNGGTLSTIASWATPSAGVLAVASTTGFPPTGTLNVVTSGTIGVITYTGISGNTFTGCAYVSGTGTVATGGAVSLAVTFWDFYTRDVFAYGMSSDGFYAYDGHGYVLDHFIAEGNGGYGVNFAVTAQTLSEPEVRNGTFKACAGGGVYMGCPGGVVAENEFATITGIGITLKGTGSKATDNTIGVTTTGVTGVGIAMQANGAIAKGNVVNQCSSFGINVQTFGAIIEGNCVYGNTGVNINVTQQSVVANNFVQFGSSYGIEVTSAPETAIIGNLVTGAALSGIFITGSAACSIQGNIVEKNVQHGILCSTSDFTVIQGNILLSNSNSSANSFDDINNSSNSVVISGNTCTGSSKSRYGINISAGGVTNNTVFGNVVTGSDTSSYNFTAGAGVQVHDNPGYNPVGTLSISVPATTVATTAQVVDSTFYITAGVTSTAVAISGGPSITIPAASLGAVRVPAGKTLTPTYTNAPTWVVEGE